MTDGPESLGAFDRAHPSTPEGWRDVAERQLKSGAPLVAYDTLAGGLARFPGDVRSRQLLALALARTGASRTAIPLLEALKAEGYADEETLGLLARVHKDLWTDDDDPQERRRHLQLAYRYYREAHQLSQGVWSGINAATTALLLGNRDEAQSLARAVRAQCQSIQASVPSAPDYWVLATVAEAALILEEWPAAEQAYARAFEVGRARVADIASTRRNARLILRQFGVDGSAIERCLRVPRVVAFAGHMIDRPGRATPRFPPELEGAARTAILDRLRAVNAGFGYASAACGADILFLESLRELGGETTVVLPYNSEQFIEDSVEIAPGAGWRQRYDRVLADAQEVVTASEQRMAGGQLSYEYVFMLLGGMAGVRADEFDTEVVPLVLWDGRPEGGRGGTARSVEHWRASNREVEIIDLSQLRQAHGPLAVATAPTASSPAVGADDPADDGTTAFEPRIVALLFADARGFSKLTEAEIPRFVHHFLGAVAGTLASSPHQPIHRNTWGDGLYLVFGGVEDAGQFALDVSERIAETDWTAQGLPAELSLRIGLHAGPAYECTDPVTGRPNYLGAHVSRAARIEPVTPPGQAYASRAFAALAHAQQVTSFTCEYVGRTPLAKGYGTFPMYVVRRRRRGHGGVAAVVS